jgi:hypothetical protein
LIPLQKKKRVYDTESEDEKPKSEVNDGALFGDDKELFGEDSD